MRDDIDDAMMARLYAQENATQKGQSGTSSVGSVMGAIRYLAPVIMRGDVAKLPPKYDGRFDTPDFRGIGRTDRDLTHLQNYISSEKGIGEDIICDFLRGVPGFTKNSTADYLKRIKASGAYARIFEVLDRTAMSCLLRPQKESYQAPQGG